MSLYLTLELIIFIIPLIFSFEKKLKFYKNWKYLFPSILLTAVLFIVADAVFTSIGVWGFNSVYHSGILIAGLPVEELLFFIVIPYSSIFIHYVFIFYFPQAFLTDTFTRILTLVIIALLLVLVVVYHNRIYTSFYSMLIVVVLLFALFEKSKILNRFYISFLIICIPFLIFNSILTGSFINEEVVWYNSSSITGFRILTIPAEDLIYGFSLILINLLLMSTFRNIKKTANP